MCSITPHLWTCQNAHIPGVELYQLAAEMEGVCQALSKVHVHRQVDSVRDRTFRRGSGSTGGLLVPETKSSYILIWCSACPGKLLPESRWASGLGVPSEAGSQRVVRTPTCGHCECPARTFSSPSGFTSTTKYHPLTLCCHHQIRNVMGFQKHH